MRAALLLTKMIAAEPRAMARVAAVVVCVLASIIGGFGLVLPKRLAPKLRGFGVDWMKEKVGVDWTVRIYSLIVLAFGAVFLTTAFTCQATYC
jgi:hypothetical protein